jgi:hypothetical protein
MDHDTTLNDADGDDDGDDIDDSLLHEHHHNWLGGTTALKFLAAGGVAGTGQRSHCHVSTTAHIVERLLAREQCRGHPQLRLTV